MTRLKDHTAKILEKGEKIPVSAFREINKHMEEIRREFIIKSIQSEQEVAKIFFTA